MKRVLLINPNTDPATTAAMLAIAIEEAPDGLRIEAMTAPEGVGMITNADALAKAGTVLAGLIPDLRDQHWHAVIIAAFGDPAVDSLRAGLDCPVIGIGEASLMAAAQYGPFAIVTTTSGLCGSIEGMVSSSGFEHLFHGVFLTMGDAERVTRDPLLLHQRLEEACHEAIAHAPLSSIIIGGGPLATAARQLAHHLPIRLIEPIPTAVHLVMERLMSPASPDRLGPDKQPASK